MAKKTTSSKAEKRSAVAKVAATATSVEERPAVTPAVTPDVTPAVSPAFTRKPAPEKATKAAVPAGLPAETDDTVCIMLNHPYGLYFRMPDGRRVELNGNGQSLIGKDKGILPIGTSGETIIKRSDWEYILKHFGGMKIFKNGLCFATRTRHDSRIEAASRSDLRNGLEPVDPTRTATKEAKDV